MNQMKFIIAVQKRQMKKNRIKHRYRRKPLRLQNWNYSWAAAYFITICTANNKRYFGQIKKGQMNHSRIGEIARQCWLAIENISKNAELGTFVIMPDHIHGIIILTPDSKDSQDQSNGTNPKTSDDSPGSQRYGKLEKKSISTIIGSYKGAVTKQARKIDPNFKWHPRFYDHIIRDDIAFRNISEYIKNNPAKWNKG